jgi:hypothetical protein
MVKDESGGAQSNNITVTPQTGTIDGVASKVIGKNYGSFLFYSDGSNWFTIAEDTVINYSNYIWQLHDTNGFLSLASADINSGSPVVSGITDTTGAYEGMLFKDTTNDYFPVNTRIVSVDSGTQVTVSQNATGTATGSSCRGGYNVKDDGNNGVIKASSGRMYQFSIHTMSTSSGDGWMFFYDTATAPDPTVDVPIYVYRHKIQISTLGMNTPPQMLFPDGLIFSNGLSYHWASTPELIPAANVYIAGDQMVLSVLYT